MAGAFLQLYTAASRRVKARLRRGYIRPSNGLYFYPLGTKVKVYRECRSITSMHSHTPHAFHLIKYITDTAATEIITEMAMRKGLVPRSF